MRPWPIVVSAAAGLALVLAYVALGGMSYRPTPVGDPCAPREVPATVGQAEAIEQVVLAAADTTACSIGVSREELILSLVSVDDLEALAEREGRDRDELEQALRDGLVRAVREAETEGLIGNRTAGVLRFAAARAPLGFLLAVLRGASEFLDELALR